jgi:hypothetical protein
MAPAVNVGGDRRVDFAANGREALTEFWGGEPIYWQALVINAAQLLELAGL